MRKIRWEVRQWLGHEWEPSLVDSALPKVSILEVRRRIFATIPRWRGPSIIVETIDRVSPVCVIIVFELRWGYVSETVLGGRLWVIVRCHWLGRTGGYVVGLLRSAVPRGSHGSSSR